MGAEATETKDATLVTSTPLASLICHFTGMARLPVTVLATGKLPIGWKKPMKNCTVPSIYRLSWQHCQQYPWRSRWLFEPALVEPAIYKMVTVLCNCFLL